MRALAWVWHADVLREHVDNRCSTCHASDCYICDQAATLEAQRDYSSAERADQ